jgi:uncharacterized protein YoxC
MPEEENGDNGAGRFDRLERVVEALAASQQHLLTAQVIVTDTVGKLAGTVGKLAGTVDTLVGTVDKLTGTVDKLVRAVGTLGEKVDSHEDRFQALIDSQLRMDQTLSRIQMLLDRQQGQ